jgi:hypothetical protein
MTDLPTLPQRAGHTLISDLIDLYMAHYAGRDVTRLQRLTWWSKRIGAKPLAEISDDDVHAALEDLELGLRRTADDQRLFAEIDALTEALALQDHEAGRNMAGADAALRAHRAALRGARVIVARSHAEGCSR